MANELDQTIEELEAEVLKELEEANGSAPLKKGAAPAEPMKKIDADEGEIEDLGDEPEKAAAKSKEVKDQVTKGEGKPEPMQKIKEGMHGKKEGMHEKMTKRQMITAMKDMMKNMPEAYKPVKNNHYDVKVTVSDREVDKVKSFIMNSPQYNRGDIEDVDSDQVDGGGQAFRGKGDIFIQGDGAGSLGVDLQKKFGRKISVMGEEADHEQMENIYAGYHEMAHPDKDMKDTSDMSNEDMHKEMMSGADKMVKSKVEKLHAAYHEAVHGGEEDDADDEMMEAHIRSIDVSDHVNALMSGEGDLSEEFKLKAATVFEAAVKAKVREELTRIQEDYNDELEETVQTHKDSLVEKVDDYLNYAVDEWINENELAIERGLKGEIAEDFIGGLRQLFEDHYVDVPDEKYDVLESQSQRIDELEEKLNEALNANISVKKENNELQRKEVISSLSEDLTYTEIEKFKSLVEDVEFDDKDTYTTKLETLKESYFPNNVQEVFESVDNVDAGPAQDIDVSDSMQAYLTALSKTAKGANN
tara:strand:- start:343 stop:1929 length:1587 start_codon:yes stop_codon:yes gene_type:complete